MGNFYDFEWGKEGDLGAETMLKMLAKPTPEMNKTVGGLLIACVVSSRGRKSSPSTFLEQIINAKRRTNSIITDNLMEAWNVLSTQASDSMEHLDTLTTFINNKHRNKTGVSDQLAYQSEVTYESFIDSWASFADMIIGFRSVMTKVFNLEVSTGLLTQLHRGMVRAKLKNSYPMNDAE